MSTATQTHWLRAETQGKPIGVDREARVVRGFVVAETGVFKDARGEFDSKALRQIVKLMKAERKGLKSRLGHPSLSDDGLGKYLGRSRDPWIETLTGKDADGNETTHERVRADLHLADVAMEEPVGGGMPLGEYVLKRAEEDPDSFGSSLVLTTDMEYRIDKKTGRPIQNEDGRELPPLWRPTQLHASDVVDTGDAVNSFLAIEQIDGLPDAVVRRGCELLDQQFSGKARDFVESRLTGFVRRYLDWRYGAGEEGCHDEDLEIIEVETRAAPSPAIEDAVVTLPPITPERDPRLAMARERMRHDSTPGGSRPVCS